MGTRDQTHGWLDAAIGALIIVLAYHLAVLPEAILARRQSSRQPLDRSTA